MPRLLGLFLFLTTNLWAFDFMGRIVPPAEMKGSARYSTSFESNATRVHQEEIQLAVPVYKDDTDAIVLTQRFQWVDISPPSPALNDFYNIDTGITYAHAYDPDKFGSLSLNFGSPSDKPYRDSTVTAWNGTALYSVKSNSESTWMLLLNYSNNRPFLNNIPILGFAYSYVPSRDFRLTVGAPFVSIYWAFAEKWSISAFGLFPWRFRTSLAYTVFGPFQVFGGFDFSQNIFLKHGRANVEERTFLDARKLIFGVKAPLSRSLFSELETGYVFDRSVFSERSYTPWPASPKAFDASWYFKIALSWMW